MPDTFDTYDEAGNRYAIYIRRSFINTGGLDGPSERLEGLPSYHLTSGEAVNRIDNETFEVVATGCDSACAPNSETANEPALRC